MKKPYSYVVIVSVIVIIILIVWLFTAKTTIEQKKREIDIKETKLQIDSIKKQSKNESDSFIQISEREAKKSNEILKSVKHEKTIVRDTTYNAMCKYIESYRPAK